MRLRVRQRGGVGVGERWRGWGGGGGGDAPVVEIKLEDGGEEVGAGGGVRSPWEFQQELFGLQIARLFLAIANEDTRNLFDCRREQIQKSNKSNRLFAHLQASLKCCGVGYY
jgi:hypothetical protein